MKCRRRRTGRAAPDWVADSHTQLFILDSRDAAGIERTPGELYIGGAGVARAISTNPELTAEKFCSASLCRNWRRTTLSIGDQAR